MVGYDFDKTIYDGDSSTDFFFYMVFTRPYLLLFAPWFLVVLALYGLRLISKKTCKECLFFFVPWHSNIDKIVNKFWEKHANKLKGWYCLQKREDDVIVSASLGFIIKPVMQMFNIKNWVATNYNIKSGKIYGKNCYGEAKVEEFERLFKNQQLDAYYSDSLSDLPMMRISKTAFLVNKDEVKEFDAHEYDRAQGKAHTNKK